MLSISVSFILSIHLKQLCLFKIQNSLLTIPTKFKKNTVIFIPDIQNIKKKTKKKMKTQAKAKSKKQKAKIQEQQKASSRHQ